MPICCHVCSLRAVVGIEAREAKVNEMLTKEREEREEEKRRSEQELAELTERLT